MKRKKIIALITSVVMLMGVSAWSNADSTDDIDVIETVVEETTDETYEYSIPTDEYEEITDVVVELLDDEGEELVINETEISTSESLSGDEEIDVEDSEEEEILDDAESEDEIEEDDDEEDEEDIEYDVEGYELYGWWVPSMNYNDDDTISFYLEDDTCFLTTPTAGVQCGDVIWQSSGLWSYVEITYGGESNLSGDSYATYCAVQDSLI